MRRYRNTLNSLGGKLKVTLLWVAGHRNLEGIEGANRLAWPSFAFGSASLVTAKGGIYSDYLTAADFRWGKFTTCTKSRSIWPYYNKNKSCCVRRL